MKQTFKTFKAPKNYTRIYSARPFSEAQKLAEQLYKDGRVVCLVYSTFATYAVYAQTNNY